jgi:hypothetical protein
VKNARALALVVAATLLALPLAAAAPAAPAATPAPVPPAALAQALGLAPAAPAALVTLVGGSIANIPCPLIGPTCCKIEIRNGCRICTDYVTCHIH